MKTKQERINEAWEEYEKIRDQAWEEYSKIQGPAYKEYRKIREQAWEEYSKIQGPAMKEYEKIQNEFNLSERQEEHVLANREEDKYYFKLDDVKEFIRLLKERINRFGELGYLGEGKRKKDLILDLFDNIDVLAGDKFK